MNLTEDLDQLAKEAKALSNEIGMLKKKYNQMPEGDTKEQLKVEIKDKQFQALFYVEKIENLSKAKKEKT